MTPTKSKAPTPIGRILLVGPVVVALVGVVAMHLLVDRWWLALPLGYGPRWIWWPLAVIPLLAFSAHTWQRARWALLTATVVALVLVGVEIPNPFARAGDGMRLRVLSFNAAVSQNAARTAARNGAAWGADLIVVVECTVPSGEASLPGYSDYKSGEICLWSRTPVEGGIEQAPRDPREVGWSGSIARGTITFAGESIVLGMVHLRSVRDELTEFLDLSELATQSDTMRERHRKRIAGSVLASAWLTPSGDLADVVVGDFNLVTEGVAYRRDWHRWRNAFDELGWGTGYTWYSRWYGLRIDHVLYDPMEWRANSIEIGENLGSDHRPLMVELSRVVGRD